MLRVPGKSGPGQQLIDAIARLFPRLQPSAPPRRGKRLDSRWGEFGLLAALYFTPFNHGTPYPSSFTDAWGRIDPAILYFVFGRPAEELPDEDVKRYQLVGADLEYAPASTLSDWHRKGIQRLAEVILDRERFLSRNHAQPSAILEPEKSQVKEHRRPPHLWRWAGLAFILSFLLILGLAGFKGWRIYQSGMQVYRDVTWLREQAYCSTRPQDGSDGDPAAGGPAERPCAPRAGGTACAAAQSMAKARARCMGMTWRPRLSCSIWPSLC